MTERKIQKPLMVSLPEESKDLLHTIAAKRIINNPKEIATAAGIAREFILEGLSKLNKEEDI